MTTFTSPDLPAFVQPLWELTRRWARSRTSMRQRRPPRHRTLAQPRRLPVELWTVDPAELREALEQSWH